jgi:hypothetical protein
MNQCCSFFINDDIVQREDRLQCCSIADAFIHNICSSQAITSVWGTLQTPNFPNPYTANDDCWCKLQHRLNLSVIVFQLIPSDRSFKTMTIVIQ